MLNISLQTFDLKGHLFHEFMNKIMRYKSCGISIDELLNKKVHSCKKRKMI